MFKKLLSNLPFNPSLIGQVTFYAKRMHQEQAVRRLGLVFVVLAMFVQMFALVSPPEPTLAESSNDIIRGGFSSREQAVNYCRSNTQGFSTILSYYKVTCDALASSSQITINSTDYGKQLRSMGRVPQGATIARTGKPTNEYPVSINGQTFYMRNLWAWDSGASSSYQALRLTNSNGQAIIILFNCGNIVTIGKYQPPVVVPPVTGSSNCVISGLPASVKPSQTFSLTFTVKNGGNIPGKETWPTTVMKLATSSPKQDGNAFGVEGNGNRVPINPNNSAYGGVLTKNGVSIRTVQFKSPSAPGSYGQIWQLISEGTARYGQYVTCGTTLTVSQTYTPPPVITPPKDACPNVPGIQSSPADCDVCPNIPGTQLTPAECDVCPNVPGIQSNPNECYPCDEAKNDSAQTACLELKKTASNKTQGITNANGTMAKANDVIVYTLSVKNKGTQKVPDFVVEENLSDVLEYSTVVDLDGGKMNDLNVVSWPKQDIGAGLTIRKKITVRVKNPVPQTPISASDKGSYDLVMTNVFYGSSVNIKLPPSVSKTTEMVVETLPNTGPGTTLIAGFAITVFVSYFFARSRLLAKELDIVRKDYLTSGGI